MATSLQIMSKKYQGLPPILPEHLSRATKKSLQLARYHCSKYSSCSTKTNKRLVLVVVIVVVG